MQRLPVKQCRDLVKATYPPYFNPKRCAVAKAVRQELKDVSALPGPARVPVLGSALAMVMNKNFNQLRIHKYWFYAAQKYGSIFRLDIIGVKGIAITNPDDIQKVFEATKDNPIRYGLDSLKKVRHDAVGNYFEGKAGILLEHDEEWWRVRKRVQGPMLKPKIIKNYLDEHNQIALEFLDKIKIFQDKFGEMPENFQVELYKWTLEAVSIVALNRRLGCLEPNLSEDSAPMKLIKNANIMFESVNDTEIGLRLWRYYETKAYKNLRSSTQVSTEIADKYIRMVVDDLENKDKNNAEITLMESLLQMPGLSYKDVVTMVLDMLFAGIDTTAHFLGFALYMLAKNPEKQRLAQKEVDEVFGSRTDFTPQDLGKLSYIKCVVKETLRFYPIGVGNLRKLTDDLELQGHLIPKGFGVLMMNVVTSRQEQYFPRAAEFIPERWYRSRPYGPIHPFASLPFGTGTRMCIGRRIAEQEMYVFLSRVLQRYNVDYKYQDMDIKTKLVFAPSEPLKFNFSERR